MILRFGTGVVATGFVLGFAATGAMAAKLPAIDAALAGPVPECVTPGRLMAFIRDRNPRLSDRYSGISVQYMRIGQDLGVRWDYAFYQMLVETGSLTYKGDVKPQQNNFAGIGATGGGARGESFPTVAEGVRAHLEHLLIYAGRQVDNPVSERTRKVQSWGILDTWRQRFGGRPVRFNDMTRK
ncbi:MAG: glucosaminidase domain-containing protein, partial [Pseudomonadota bacterium]